MDALGIAFGELGFEHAFLDPDHAVFEVGGDFAAGGQLFSHAAVTANRHEWCGRIVAPDGFDQAVFDEILGYLQAGLAGLGKTGAIITAKSIAARPNEKAGSPPLYALTLLTPALLNNVAELRKQRSLFDDYAAYWQGHGFDLVRHYAKQRLEGGYIALRYPPPSDSARPDSYVLTEPGSVFLLRAAAGSSAGQAMARMQRFGLPPNGYYGRVDWTNCPFLPSNGFGQVQLDRVDHEALAQGVFADRAA